MNSARAGFYWWQLDLTYWMLRGLQSVGVVWDLHEVPASVMEEGRRGGRDAAVQPGETTGSD
jgi:stearoyl-CoA desaturase (delta-9 desaturase)